MKKKSIALLLALMMMLSAVSAFAQPAESTAAQEDDPVLASVNGKAITKSQVEAQIPNFLNNQFITEASDYRSVLDVIIRREIVMKKVGDMGFDQFTPEEEDSFRGEAQEQWDAAIAYYADYNQSTDSTQARDAAVKQAEDMFASEGITLDLVMEDIRNSAAMDRMDQYLMGGYEPTEEEILDVFQSIGAMYQQTYENDIGQYEYMTQYSGQNSWYTPDGYRGIIHILLAADETLAKNYQTLSAAYEEQQQSNEVLTENSETQSTEAPAEEPSETITQQMLDEARQAVLDSRKADVEMIYERLGRGESFLDLIKEYGEDPGMTDAANLEEGYPVHAQSIVYDPAFTAAAFSEKMQKPGDISDPAVGSFGIHILQYLRDVPSGLIMTDAIHLEIEDYLLSVKQNEVYAAAFESWMTQEEVIYHQEAIDLATEQAAQSSQSPEELPLEALPDAETQTP